MSKKIVIITESSRKSGNNMALKNAFVEEVSAKGNLNISNILIMQPYLFQ